MASFSPCHIARASRGVSTPSFAFNSANFPVHRESSSRQLVPTHQRRDRFIARARNEEKPQVSFGDRLLDYIEGGPKLRRWYGASELMPRDGSLPDEEKAGGEAREEDDEEEGPADAVLVTDGDNETGQMVILSLILKRQKIRALVKDAALAAEGYGPYVEPIAGSVTDAAAVQKALKGAGTVIITGKAGLVPEKVKSRSVRHIILLSKVGVSKPSSNPLESLVGGASRDASRRDEEVVRSAGVPHTIMRTGQLRDEPSGSGVLFGQGDVLRGSLAREDAAAVCLAALEAGPPPGCAREFEVVNSPAGASNDAQFLDEVVRLSAAVAVE